MKEAQNGEVLENCKAYIAPGGKHLRLVEKENKSLYIQLTDAPPVNKFKPSVDYLFHSASELSVAKKTVAVLLTGMGNDGAKGLLALKKSGAMTMAQNEDSCVVFGMPKAAIELNAALAVVDLKDIIKVLFNKNLYQAA